MVPTKQVLLICLVLATLALSAPSLKIDKKLSALLQKNTSVNIIVKFKDGNRQAITRSQQSRFGTRLQHINNLVSSLKFSCTSSQQNALKLLQARSLAFAKNYKQIWATNELYVEGASAQLVNLLAALPEVTEIREEFIVHLEQLELHTTFNLTDAKKTDTMLEWNLDKIEVSKAWQLPGAGGGNGHGIVVANIDSGVRHTHEALRNNFRGNYGWFDPFSGSEHPIDDSGHGTHTMGTLAGSGGIGVAPGAQWIACRACGTYCTESALKACGQWILCPTLANGQSPNCDQAPRVVSNSWGGGQGSDFYNDIIEAWKAANIIPIFSIGNSGPNCGTAMSPGDQDDVIAVGATTLEDNIWVSSSAGPSAAGVIKPDISAPGHLIRSAGVTSDTDYYETSGTSMACPHVAGVVALLLSQNPNLSYSEIKHILENSTDRSDLIDTGKICGGISSMHFPNNQYGQGRLNAFKAIEKAISGLR